MIGLFHSIITPEPAKNSAASHYDLKSGDSPRKRLLFLSFFCALALLLTAMPAFREEVTVYSGGLIYGKAGVPPLEAVVVQNGKFSYAGSLDVTLQAAGKSYRRVGLQGRVMLPSFFDAHAHPNLGSLLDLRELTYAGACPRPKNT